LLRRAAEGVVNAQYWYGRMLVEGRGVDVDLVEGRAWIARAAEAGFVDAKVALGEMLVNGRGGPRDHEAARLLFSSAADDGHIGATFALAALYGGGHDIPTDRPAAQRLFRKAAERGHGIAQMMLGRYLARGLAGGQDVEEARVWLERAHNQGVTAAAADLAALPDSVPSRVASVAD
jgi:uncharacterized protein